MQRGSKHVLSHAAIYLVARGLPGVVAFCAIPLFTRLLAAGLVDVGRTLDPDNNELFTFWAPWRNLRQRNIGWRIDYVLATAGIASRARSSASRREFGTSDHAPVVVEFS